MPGQVKISNRKLQIPKKISDLKSQMPKKIQISNPQLFREHLEFDFCFLGFVIWILGFGFCDLSFDI